MILSDTKIQQAIDAGRIVIRPFRPECLGSNSYDVHLGRYLATYRDGALDARKANAVEGFTIPPHGFVLVPGQLYLGVTEEYTETHDHVPFLEGKSSVGRLGIDIHSTAGKGDVGFCNYWTLEMSVKLPGAHLPGDADRTVDLLRGLGRSGPRVRHEEIGQVSGRLPPPDPVEDAPQLLGRPSETDPPHPPTLVGAGGRERPRRGGPVTLRRYPGYRDRPGGPTSR